ncbi:MAG: enolase C-terminal domain-like protein [Myxococcales bacterium]
MTTRICPRVRPVSAWLSDAVGGSGHRTCFRQGFELELSAADGSMGVGEASPLPNYSAERIEHVAAELHQLEEFDVSWPLQPIECNEFVTQVTSRMACQLPSVRFALEGALVDLCARRFNLPAASLLAIMAARTEAHQELSLSKLLASNDLPSLLGAARHATGRGYNTVKVKLGLGRGFDRELDDLRVLRERIGFSIKLRLDPNQSCSKSDLAGLLVSMQCLQPEFVEEPVSLEELIALEFCPVPLAIDESLRDAQALERLTPHLSRLNIRAVVIKPALVGLSSALALAHCAENLGLDVVITHLFDGPIGHAIASSLALAVGTPTRAHGLAPHPGLLLSPERRVSGLGAGHLRLVAQAGLPLSECAPC